MRRQREYDLIEFDEYSDNPHYRWRLNKTRAAVIGAGLLVGLALAGVFLRRDARERKIDWTHTSPHRLAPEKKSILGFEVPPHDLVGHYDKCAALATLKKCSPSWSAARCVLCCAGAREKHNCASNPSNPICRSCCTSIVSNSQFCGSDALKQSCTECCVEQVATKRGHKGCCNFFRSTKYCDSWPVWFRLKYQGKEGCKKDTSAACVACGRSACE